ncbi:unnamed protein product [Diamesa serratosioi]
MSIEQRFTAAVNVIRGLPKNGSYVPSHDMMLRFYSLFKQGTEGPCKEKRPAFWDVVGKIKHDSWKRLGNMPKEKAMQEYVDELKKIVETMSYTDNVANFMGSIDELDNISVEDLQLVAPEAIKKVRSRPNSPFHSRETSPIRSEIEYTNGSAYKNGYTNGHHQSTDTSDEEYIDTVELLPSSSSLIDPALISQLVQLTDRMNHDLLQVTNRMGLLEQKIAHQRRKNDSWWPFQDISPSWFIFTIMWPIAVSMVFQAMRQNKLSGSVRRS